LTQWRILELTKQRPGQSLIILMSTVALFLNGPDRKIGQVCVCLCGNELVNQPKVVQIHLARTCGSTSTVNDVIAFNDCDNRQAGICADTAMV